MPSTATVTLVFARLKLSLLRNGLRQSQGRSAAFVASALLALAFGVLGLVLLLALRGHQHIAPVAVSLVALLAVAWAFVPLFVGGSDETLDPGRLVMLPLRPTPLMVSLLVASLIGIGPLFTVLIVTGAALGTARGAAGTAVALLAVPLVLLVCTTLARALAAANARLLTSRKGRDLAVFSGLVIAFGFQGLNLAMSRMTGTGDIGPIQTMADIARLLPPASAIDAVRAAGEGAYGTALLGLATTVAALGLLLWWWQRTLTRLMTSPDSSTLEAAPGRETPGKRRWRGGDPSALLPAGRTGTVMLRTLRYGRRDPKTKLGWVTALGMGLLMPVVFAVQGGASVYHVVWVAGLLGLLMYNQFGQDYSAFWLVAQTITTSRDALVELRARALALGLIAVPFTVVVVVISAASTGSWAELPPALGLALALLGALMGAGALTSARYPYSIPQDNAMKNVAPGQGALAWISLLCGTLAGGAVCAPLIALAVWLGIQHPGWMWTVLPLGMGYGLLLAGLGLRLAAPRVAGRLPEILAAVSRE
ncbi:transporter [Streptomyces sp. ACA25]|nr:transporter [Streptomyces sp. ACA25]MDB1088169.1 transporter [Streptomyces sp. ACA25]